MRTWVEGCDFVMLSVDPFRRICCKSDKAAQPKVAEEGEQCKQCSWTIMYYCPHVVCYKTNLTHALAVSRHAGRERFA